MTDTAHPTLERPRRLWRYPASQLTRPNAFQLFLGTDEFHNPTLALGLPWIGMWVLAYPRRLNTVVCVDGDCQTPGCEIAEFYREKAWLSPGTVPEEVVEHYGEDLALRVNERDEA